MSKEINECLTCDAYDPDLGCTMPSVDLSYACPYEEDKEFEEMLQSCGDLPGQVVIFINDEDDYPY